MIYDLIFNEDLNHMIYTSYLGYLTVINYNTWIVVGHFYKDIILFINYRNDIQSLYFCGRDGYIYQYNYNTINAITPKNSF